MTEIYRLPELLDRNIGSERRDFAVIASRSQPLKMSMAMIFSVPYGWPLLIV